MSEQLAPRPYSDRELTLRAISLTFQRAKAAQLDLTGAIDVHPEGWSDDGDRSPDDVASDEATARLDADEFSDVGLDRADGDDMQTPGGLNEPEEDDLPNPIVTDANFRHYLEQATINQTDADTEGRRGRVETLRALASDRATQARYNDALLNAVHQLDHRTRLQQQTITRLEAELADARRALAALESDESRSR